MTPTTTRKQQEKDRMRRWALPLDGLQAWTSFDAFTMGRTDVDTSRDALFAAYREWDVATLECHVGRAELRCYLHDCEVSS